MRAVQAKCLFVTVTATVSVVAACGQKPPTVFPLLFFGGFCFFLKPTKRGRSKARALGSQLSRELKGQRPQPGPPPLQELRSGLGKSGVGPAGSGAGLSATAELSSERAVAELSRAASQAFVVARCGSVVF